MDKTCAMTRPISPLNPFLVHFSFSPNCLLLQNSNSPFLSHRRRALFQTPFKRKPTAVAKFSESDSPGRAANLQSETLEILEWRSLCNQLSPFTSTSMALSLTQSGQIPIGQTVEESRNLLDETTAALKVMKTLDSEQLGLASIEDVSAIVRYAASRQLLSVQEICRVQRTLRAARAVWEKLVDIAADSDRYNPLLRILESCNFQMQLEQKIEFCIESSLLIVLDRASEELGLIRAERKRNTEKLDSLLKEVSGRIFQAGGVERPLITKRRSRMCVGIKASYKYLLPDAVVLNVSSSGVTFFMEPKEAIALNNMEVRLSNTEKAEEMAILSLLTAEIAEAEADIMYLLDRVKEVDLAFARAAYSRWVYGVCPTFISNEYEENPDGSNALSVDIEGIQHPLLLGSSLRDISDVPESTLGNPSKLSRDDVGIIAGNSPQRAHNFPVPIDIKVGCGTRVVIISGPNTGGKTASMKTLGLASLMSKAGMYLPAKNQPRLPWFDLLLADIGDSQSLEQSLSTFSGHISRICGILAVASKKSLVLVDEIGSGTDPTEGIALSTSILHYLKDRVNLGVVTTHYVDLSRLKDNDSRFENAAMEFSLESLRPTYQIRWGSIGDSNALAIAESIGFNKKIIERAKGWVESLKAENQERKGVLYQSLMEERNRLEAQFKKASSLHTETMELYHEIDDEAKDLDKREIALREMEKQKVEQEMNAAKSGIDNVIQEFENQLKRAAYDEFTSLIRKAESSISSIVKAHSPAEGLSLNETDTSNYELRAGEIVQVKGLGNKLATVVEVMGDDDTVLLQYGKVRVRVKKNNIRATQNQENTSTISIQRQKTQKNRKLQNSSDAESSDEASYGAVVKTSKNSVDLRGMRAEEAVYQLEMAIATRGPQSVLFIVHGTGTGVLKERALEILRNHPRVIKYEHESPVNYGCTIAYIK